MSAKQLGAWGVEQRAVWGLLSSVFFLFTVTASAQNLPFIDDPPPLASKTAPAEESGQTNLVETAVTTPLAPEKEMPEKWEQELLRDPFWPVGFFPPNWQTKADMQSGADLGGSGWKAALAKLQISGTSRLGDRTAAIINGALKTVGDPVEVMYEGKTYQWQIDEIDAEGKIHLKKLGIK